MALRIEIKVVPASGKLGCIIDKHHKLKCYLKAQAEEGKANYELIKFLSKQCGITQREIEIIAGLTSRNKILLLQTDLTEKQLLEIMGLEQQPKLF